MLHNPSNLFSGGNVVLDNTPYLRIAMQQRARKDARDQALNQYYQKLPDTVNDKGTRDIEIPILNKMKGDMMEYGIKNRDALINPKLDGGMAQLTIQQQMRDYSSVTRKSQAAGLIDHQLGQMYFNPKNQDLLNSDYFLQAHASHTLPVTNDKHKDIDIASLMANRPFDENAYAKSTKTKYPYSEGTPTIAPHPTDKNLETVTTNPVLAPQTKEAMYADAASDYHNTPSFKAKVDSYSKNPADLARLNEVSKNTFGHEIHEPEDLAAAYTAAQLPTTGVRVTLRESISAKNKEYDRRKAEGFIDWLKKNNITSSQKDARTLMNKAGDATVGYPLDSFVNKYGIDHVIKDADNNNLSTIKRVYEKDLPQGELNRYNKLIKDKNGNMTKEVEPFVDEKGNAYYNASSNSEGHNELLGEQGKIASDESRYREINNIPANKGKQGIYFNKEGKTTGTEGSHKTQSLAERMKAARQNK